MSENTISPVAPVSPDQIRGSEILSDNMLIKILRFLDLKNRSKVAVVSKQFSECNDYILSKKTSIRILTQSSNESSDLPTNTFEFCVIQMKDKNKNLNPFPKYYFDMKDTQTKYDSFFRKLSKLSNLTEITFEFWSGSTKLIEWLTQIFKNSKLSIKFYQTKFYTYGYFYWKQNHLYLFSRGFASRICHLSASFGFVSKCDLRQFSSLRTLNLINDNVKHTIPILCKSLSNCQNRVKAFSVENYRIKRNLIESLGKSFASKSLNYITINCDNEFDEKDIFDLMAKYFSVLTSLTIKIKRLNSLDSLNSLSKLRIFQNFKLHLKYKSELCFNNLNDNSNALQTLMNLEISGKYRIKNIGEMCEMFPNLIELKLFDYKIEFNTSETDNDPFECVYNQIKELVVLAHFQNLKTLEVHFRNTTESKDFRLILKAMFDIFIDFEKSLKLFWTKTRQTTIDSYVDLALLSNLIPLNKINYLVCSHISKDINLYHNIFPENVNLLENSCPLVLNAESLFQKNVDLCIAYLKLEECHGFGFYSKTDYTKVSTKFWI